MQRKKMIDLKPYGAFVENTIRPLLDEFKDVIGELSKYGLNFSEDSLARLSKPFFKLYVYSLIADVIKTMVTVGSVCLVAYLVLR